MKIYEDQARAEGRAQGFAEGREEGRAEGREEGRAQGLVEARETSLAVLVRTLKKVIPSFEDLYKAVIANEEYKDVTRENVRMYYGN